jgi:hypothetical protein
VYGEFAISACNRKVGQSCPKCPTPLPCSAMKDLLILLAHLLTTIAKLPGPGGARAIVADSLLMKQRLLMINRARRRAPDLSALDRFLLGLWSLFLNPRRIRRAAVILRPATLPKFHRLLTQRKYRQLYSAHRKGKSGPKGPCAWRITNIGSRTGACTILPLAPIFSYPLRL